MKLGPTTWKLPTTRVRSRAKSALRPTRLALETLEARRLLAAFNLVFPPADVYPSEPLRLLPVIRSQGGTLEASMDMVTAGFDSNPILYGGQPIYSSPPDPSSPNNPNNPVYAMAYQVDAYGQSFPAQFPGPIFQLDPGDALSFHVTDNLAPAGTPSNVVFNTNLHTHGLHVSPLNNGDNVYREIVPGEGMDVHIPVGSEHPRGLNWYHVHRHGSTHDQVYGGLAGLLVVGDPLDPWPQYKDSLTQVYMALSEVNIQDGNLSTYQADLTGANAWQGWQKPINGQVNPTITLRPGETQVWNLGAIGAFGNFNVAITDENLQNPWNATLLVQDGNGGVHNRPYSLPLAADTQRMKDLAAATLLMPGNRLTMAVTAPTTPGTYYLIDGFGGQNKPATTAQGQQEYYVLATIQVAGETVVKPPPVFGDIGTIDPLFHATPDITRNFEFSIKAGATPEQNVFLINGKVFGAGVMPQLQIGTVEEWVLTNPKLPGANANHPFHIHQGDFVVVAVNGQPVDPNATPPPSQSSLAYISGRDVIDIPSGGSITIRFNVEDYPGKYVFHCHILKHEDLGMMSPLLAFGPAQGLRLPLGTPGGQAGSVMVMDGYGDVLGTIQPFSNSYRGEVVAASALGQSAFFQTMAVATGTGYPIVKVYEGGSLVPRTTFRAFTGPLGRRGVSVAVGDFDGDGNADIVVGSRAAGVVRIFDRDGNLLREFRNLLPGRLPRGVNVAAGDVNGDNFDDLVISAGAGREPLVLALDGQEISRGVEHPETLFQFVAGGGSRAGARVSVGYVAPGTLPSYLANVITTPEIGRDTGLVQVWNPGDFGVGGGHSSGEGSMHGASATRARGVRPQQGTAMPIARFRPFGGSRAALQVSNNYQGRPGTPVVANWVTPHVVAFTTIDANGHTMTEIRREHAGRPRPVPIDRHA